MPLRVAEGVDIPVERLPAEGPVGGSPNLNAGDLPTPVTPAPGQPHRRLGVQTVSQMPMSLWCWAACTEMVLRFLGAPMDKCRVAQRQLGPAVNCCGPSPEACNVGLSVEDVGRAFERAGLAGDHFSKLSFESVQRQINGNPALGIPPRPVVAGIRWQNGGGHLVVVSGWRVAGPLNFVKVNDPFYTTGDILYENLVGRYGPNDNGVWEHTWTNFRRV
jgi:Papain-like cysteine protease AvrRpt2